MLTSVGEIRNLCQETMELFGWSAVPLGHPLRNHSYAYREWGIGLTPDNIDEIKSTSKSEYRREWQGSDQRLNQLIAEASVKAGLSDTNLLLNRRIARYSKEHVVSLAAGGHRPHLIEIGTGAGGTIIAILASLREAGFDISGMDLLLIEPSRKRVDFALERIKESMGGTPLPAILRLEGTVDALSGLASDSADLVVQNAAIHHESFKDHLVQINRVLKPGMPFISGDWHEGTYETPARIFWLYAMLQDPFNDRTTSAVRDFVSEKSPAPWFPLRAGLTEFRRRFALSDQRLASAFEGFTASERRASCGGMEYWLGVAKIFTEKGEKSPEAVIQCHERVSKRAEALVNAGFVFDAESRAKYHEVIKDRGYGELGAVMVPKKPIRSNAR
jgi:SAM-dependent methyltransferase